MTLNSRDETKSNNNNRKIIREFSHFKSKCICYCCSQTSYCQSWNNLELLDEEDMRTPDNNVQKESNLKIVSEYSFERSIKFRKFRFIFKNYIYKLFSSFSIYRNKSTNINTTNAQNKRKKLNLLTSILVSIFFIYIIFFIGTHLFTLNEMRLKRLHAYDLMSDALKRQNISRHKITCNGGNISIENSTRSNLKSLTNKYLLFNDYYRTSIYNNYSHIGTYDLNFDTYFDSKSPQFLNFIKTLKLCMIKSYQSHFQSIKIDSSNFKLFEVLDKDNFIPGK